jgi:pyruvate formate lyase activating enzyme
MFKEARFYEKLENLQVRCLLCPHYCKLSVDQTGICGARKNRGGLLYAMGYGEITSYGLDPIEKKPLFHYYPGKKIFSIGSYGCNLKCDFCQNYRIAHERPGTVHMEPEKLLELALSYGDESIGVAFTYNEPIINAEYIIKCAKLIHAEGMKVVLVTNGFINEDPLEALLEQVDAMNIDLKAFNEKFYTDICCGAANPVKKTIERACRSVHVEVTTLLIEGLNTDEREMDEMSRYLGGLKSDMPFHLSRYFPAWKRKDPPTPIERIRSLAEIARRHLNHVYIGNVPGADNNTYCPECRALIVDRSEYEGMVHNLNNGICEKCGRRIMIRHE